MREGLQLNLREDESWMERGCRVKLEVWKNSLWLRTDASPVSSGGAVMLVEAASARRAVNTLGTRKLLGPGSW